MTGPMVESFRLGIMISVTAVQSIVLHGSSISCRFRNCLRDVKDVGIRATATLSKLPASYARDGHQTAQTHAEIAGKAPWRMDGIVQRFVWKMCETKASSRSSKE